MSFDGRVAGLSKTFDLVATSLSGVRGDLKTRVEELSATLAEAEKQWEATVKVGIAQYPYPYTQTCSYTRPDAYPIPITRQVKKLTSHTHSHPHPHPHPQAVEGRSGAPHNTGDKSKDVAPAKALAAHLSGR